MTEGGTWRDTFPNTHVLIPLEAAGSPRLFGLQTCCKAPLSKAMAEHAMESWCDGTHYPSWRVASFSPRDPLRQPQAHETHVLRLGLTQEGAEVQAVPVHVVSPELPSRGLLYFILFFHDRPVQILNHHVLWQGQPRGFPGPRRKEKSGLGPHGQSTNTEHS